MNGTVQAVATEFFRHLSDNDLRGAMALLSEDCEIWIASTSALVVSEYVGTSVPKAEFVSMMAKTQQLAANGMQFTVRQSLTQDSTTVLEVESLSELSDGRIYSNRYTFWLTVENSCITGLREYFDTKYAESFFLGLLSAAED